MLVALARPRRRRRPRAKRGAIVDRASAARRADRRPGSIAATARTASRSAPPSVIQAVARHFVAHRLAEPEMGGLMGDEPAGAVAHVADSRSTTPIALEGHADLARQRRCRPCWSAPGVGPRPADQQRRRRPGVRPERVGVAAQDGGRGARRARASASRQRRIDHRGDLLARRPARAGRTGHRCRRRRSGVAPSRSAGRRGAPGPAASRKVTCEPLPAKALAVEIDAAAPRPRPAEATGSSVEMAAPQRDRAVGEDQRRIIFARPDRRRPA